MNFSINDNTTEALKKALKEKNKTAVRIFIKGFG